MLDYNTISTAFFSTLERQRHLHGKPLTKFDRGIADVILRASLLAMEDVEQRRIDRHFKVVSAPTGSGKSTSAVALAATMYSLDPSFTCAFVVDTGRQCDEVYSMLRELLPAAHDIAVWSVYHDVDADPAEVEETQGFRPSAQFHPGALRTSRIVVCTHARWKREMVKNKDAGVRRCNGEPRSLLFVDEHPSLVKLIEKQPHDVMSLRDALVSNQPDHPVVPILNGIIARMDEAFNDKGAAYVAVELVTPAEADCFRQCNFGSLLSLTSGNLEERKEAASVHEETVRFLCAAADGCVFLSRNAPASFVSYELEFRPGPGYVLLDATADLSGMSVLMKGMEDVKDVPRVDFRNLEIVHLKGPKSFANIRKTVETARTAKPYAEWITKCVLDNTSPGDRVLLVACRKLFDHEYLVSAEDAAHPVDWSGRVVSTLHWGAGIGSNRYKDATHVFLFGEFYIPKKAVIGNVLGHRQHRASEADLSGAVGGTMRGAYLTAMDGHLLRWHKQLSCRGNVRNIDGDGVCGRMKLFTDMNFTRLTRHLPVLFPGAIAPSTQNRRRKGDGDRDRATERLVELLSSTTETLLSSQDVEKLTGVRARDLGNNLRATAVAATAALYGWRLVSAREIGEAGKRKFLVKTQEAPSNGIVHELGRSMNVEQACVG